MDTDMVNVPHLSYRNKTSRLKDYIVILSLSVIVFVSLCLFCMSLYSFGFFVVL